MEVIYEFIWTLVSAKMVEHPLWLIQLKFVLLVMMRVSSLSTITIHTSTIIFICLSHQGPTFTRPIEILFQQYLFVVKIISTYLLFLIFILIFFIWKDIKKEKDFFWEVNI